MRSLPTRLALPIKCIVDQEGRLVAADAAIRRLHLANSGQEGGLLAVPALLELAILCSRTGLRIERSVFVAEKNHDLELWVEAEKQNYNVQLSVVGWHERDSSYSSSQPLQASPAKAPERECKQSMQISREAVILRASAALACAFGDDLIVSSFDEHFELVGNADTLAGMLKSSVEVPEKLEVRQRSTQNEHIALVDVIRSDIGEVAGVYLAFLLSTSDSESLSEPEKPIELQNSAMGLGRHFASAVRQPLGRILANAETIGSELNGPIFEQYSSYAKDIASAARHLSDLVSDLEDLDAIDRPEFKVARELVELSDIAHRVAGLLALKAADHQIELIIDEQGCHCNVLGEFRRVLQIVLNLVGNAIRYSPGGSAIRISIDTDSSSISVDDQGPGIPEEDRERVFAKFERLGRSGDGGSGLGLYISRKLARSMGGELVVEKGEAGGARFTLSLPAFS